MVNFDDMTLEELQQLLRVNTKNPNEVKKIQEISGLTGKAVDGIWGKQTSKAWNNFIDKNKSDIEQAIHDEQNYQNAIARGQSSPAVEDLVSFSNQLDQQNQARNVKISQLEQQIAQVKERINRNARALTGKSYEDANKKLATLEMDKIGVRLNRQPAQSDPTMLWRWNQGRLDTLAANAAQDAKTSASWKKDANYVMSAEYDNSNDASMVMTQNNIRKVIEEGRLLGKTDEELSPLYNKLNEIQNDRDNLSVTTRKESVIKDIQTTISEGAVDTADKDIDDALNNGIINERDAEKLRLRLNEKRFEKERQRKQRKDEDDERRRKILDDKKAASLKSDEDYLKSLLGGK